MKSKSGIFVVALVVHFFTAGVDGGSVKERIYGGIGAGLGELPYMVSLRRGGEHDCGGALISRRHVLTAYHCIDNGYENLTAVVGTNSLRTGGHGYRVAGATIYPPYDGADAKDGPYDHDIAVLTLEEEVKLSWLVSTIRLPDSEVRSGARVQLAGWGDDYTQQNSPFLLKLSLSTVRRTACEAYYRNLGYGYLVKNHTVCAFKKRNYGACFGDSGGPLIHEGRIVGVLSIGFDACGLGVPEIFESVYYYLDFIKSVISLQ